MDTMFPLPQRDNTTSPNAFLDHAVLVNLESGWKRVLAPMEEVSGVHHKSNSGLEFGTGDILLPKDSSLTNGDDIAPSGTLEQGNEFMIFSRTGSGVVVGEEANGKTVKSLSRLWRYLGGNSPDE